MDAYLTNTIGVANHTLRGRLIAQRFSSLNRLYNKEDSFVPKVASAIRKLGGPTAAAMTVELEEDLSHLVKWAKYTHTIQRNLDYATATLDNIRNVGIWSEALPDKAEAVDPGRFTYSAKFKVLLENIRQYLGIVTNKAGLPLAYVIRLDSALPAVDQGFGQPSFDEELARRGRHDGWLWRPSNKLVWNMIRTVTHGTDAWNHVRRFATAGNGRQAYLVLVATYMGRDVQYNIKHAAMVTLQRLRFDNRSRTFTFDVFTGRFKDALNELDDPNMDEETKVMKFKAAFQVKEVGHLHSIIASTPALRGSLDNTISFVGEQLRNAKQNEDSRRADNRSVSACTRTSDKDKSLHEKWVNCKHKKNKKKEKPNNKFDPVHV